jgi:hypothetical protein
MRSHEFENQCCAIVGGRHPHSAVGQKHGFNLTFDQTWGFFTQEAF